MSKGFIFWLLMILWVVFGCYGGYLWDGVNRHYVIGGSLLLFILLFLLGWHSFGFVVQ